MLACIAVFSEEVECWYKLLFSVKKLIAGQFCGSLKKFNLSV